MNKGRIKDLYTDYLLSSFGKTTAIGLSSILDGVISHDQVTRFLPSLKSESKELWKEVKPLVRAHEKENTCLIFDDSIIEKEYTDENEVISWHYDHSKKKTVKGIGLLTAFYHTQISHTSKTDEEVEAFRIPIFYEVITKIERYYDQKTKKEKRKSTFTKNKLLQQMIAKAISNQLVFKYVIADFGLALLKICVLLKLRRNFSSST